MTVTKVAQAGLSLTEAFSGVLQTNANFVDQVIFGPAVDGRAWNGLWNKASVFSSLMLATIEDEGSNTEINIWDLTQQSAGSPSTTVLATVDLSAAATPTAIAACMGYLIVSSEDGIAIIDPHSGAWAERTKGWPRTLSSSTSPALTNNDVVSVCAGLSDQPAYDPRTGGPFPTFGLVYGTGADCSAIIKDDGTSYDQAGTVGGKGCAIFNGFFVYPDTAAGRMKRNGLPISTITADDWAENDMGQPGSYPEILGSDQQISFSSTLGALCDANGLSLVSGLNQVKSAIQGIGMSALINRTYNTGYLPVDIRGAWLANSNTVDRSYKGNTLTNNGTVPTAAVASGAELTAYGVFSGSNNLTRASDGDWDAIGTGTLYESIWFNSTGPSTTEYLFSISNSAQNIRMEMRLNGTDTLNLIVQGATAYSSFDTGFDVSDSVWHKADFVHVSSTERYMYIDGVEVGSATTDTGSITSSGNLPLGIGVFGGNGSSGPATTTKLALARLSATAPTATQIRQMYDAEKGMFEANAECLLQSGTTDAVLDVNVDPLTNKVLVTQTDAITVFDGLVVDSKPTVNSGSSEKGKLWGDLRAEQNSANAYVTAPATDQRQVNEMVRGLANEMPAGVDLSKAKAWIYGNTDGTISASYNIKTNTSGSAGLCTVAFGTNFKSANYVAVGSCFDASGNIDFSISIGEQYTDRVAVQRVEDSSNVDGAFYIVFFGELENE